MKKFILLISITIIFVLITGCNNESYGLKKINYNKLQEKMSNKDTFVLYIGSRNCSVCVNFEPTVKEVVSENKIIIYKLDIADFSKEEKTSLQETFDFRGTPTIVYLSNGEETSVLNRLEGAVPKSTLIDYLKKNNIIK